MKNKLVIILILIIPFCLISVLLIGILVYINSGTDDNGKEKTSTAINEDNSDNTNTENTNTTDAIRLIFIHHSSGENWLSDSNGQLGKELKKNNYFVSDTNYGWGPIVDSLGGPIGDYTDIGYWWNWFRSSDSNDILDAVYNESGQNSEYSRLTNTPEGENEIIMFKSCFPNSNLLGEADDPIPNIKNNPLKGFGSDSEYHTISNAKGIYIDLLKYFETKQDKLFVVITAPPLGEDNTSEEASYNAREFNSWLKKEWLKNYNYKNVVVFDFYDVLTNNGESNYSQYTSDEYDDHPNQEGNRKATSEFIPFLNAAYEEWK